MKINKGALQGLKNGEDIIERLSQRTMIKNTPNKIKKNNILAKNKVYFNSYYGLTNPSILNISKDTLNKIKGE